MRGKLDHRVGVQLGALWLLGGLVMPTTVGIGVLLFFGGPLTWAIGLLGGLGLLAGYLWTVVTFTAPVTRLGATVPARLLWVAVVLVGGTLVWWQGWEFADAAELTISRSPLLTGVFGGLAYALVGGLLLRGWRFNLATIAVLLAVTTGGLAALRASGPDDLDARIQHAGVNPDLMYVADIPAYAPVGQLGSRVFMPADPAAIPPLQYVNVVGYGPDRHRTPDATGCGATLPELSTADCTVEPGGAVYWRGVTEHGYRVDVGDWIVVVAGSLAVDRDLLRAAARSARAGTAADLPDHPDSGPFFVADLPGFRPQPTGSPPGVQYLRADHASGEQSVQVNLSVVSADQGDLCFMSTCEPDGPDLTYWRREEAHGYVHRRGDVIVTSQGGVSVDRELLRRTALAARPATDAELLRALPAPPPRDKFDRLRGWLRANA